jgi:hypothetical protein
VAWNVKRIYSRLRPHTHDRAAFALAGMGA